MGLFSKKYKPEKFAEGMFEAVIYYANENNKIFKENVSKNYHETLFMIFFTTYGIFLVNYFINKKYGGYSPEVSKKLYSLFYERVNNSFPKEQVDIITECAADFEEKIIEAFELPFDDGLNNPFYELSLYLPTVLDIQDDYDPLYANTTLFTCLGEAFAEIGKIVHDKDLKD